VKKFQLKQLVVVKLTGILLKESIKNHPQISDGFFHHRLGKVGRQFELIMINQYD